MKLNRRQLLLAGAGLAASTLQIGHAASTTPRSIESAPSGSSDNDWKGIQNL